MHPVCRGLWQKGYQIVLVLSLRIHTDKLGSAEADLRSGGRAR